MPGKEKKVIQYYVDSDVLKRLQKLNEKNHFEESNQKQILSGLLNTTTKLQSYINDEGDIEALEKDLPTLMGGMFGMARDTFTVVSNLIYQFHKATPGTSEYKDLLELVTLVGIAGKTGAAYNEASAKSVIDYKGNNVFQGSVSALRKDFDTVWDQRLDFDKVNPGVDMPEQMEFMGDIDLDDVDFHDIVDQTKNELEYDDGNTKAPSPRLDALAHMYLFMKEANNNTNIGDSIRRLDDQIETLKQSSSPQIFEYMSGAHSIEEMTKRTEEILQKSKQASSEFRAIRNTAKDQLVAFLKDSGYTFEPHSVMYNLLDDLMRATKPDGIDEKFKDKANSFLKPLTNGDHTNELVNELYSFAQANAPKYTTALTADLFYSSCEMNLGNFWKTSELEFKKSYMLATAKQRGGAGRDASITHPALSALREELERIPKGRDDSDQFNELVGDLAEAAMGGSMHDLAVSAEKYVKAREGILFSPFTEAGRHRLRIARKILGLAKLADKVSIESLEAEEAVVSDESVLDSPEAANAPADPSSASPEAANAPAPAETRGPKLLNGDLEIANTLKPVEKPEALEQKQKELENKKKTEEIQKETPKNEEYTIQLDPNDPTSVEVVSVAKVNGFETNLGLAWNNSAALAEEFKTILSTPDLPANANVDEHINLKDNGYVPLDDKVRNHYHDVELPTQLLYGLSQDTKKPYDECVKLVPKLMDIVNRNLSGYRDLDIKKAYTEYRKEFLLPNPETGEPPIVPGYDGKFTGQIFMSFAPMYQFITSYDKVCVQQNGIKSPEMSGRDLLMKRQLDSVINKYIKLEENGTLKSEYVQVILDAALEPECTVNQRAFLKSLAPDKLREIQDKCPNIKTFKTALDGAKKQYDKNLKDEVEAQYQYGKESVDNNTVHKKSVDTAAKKNNAPAVLPQ